MMVFVDEVKCLKATCTMWLLRQSGLGGNGGREKDAGGCEGKGMGKGGGKYGDGEGRKKMASLRRGEWESGGDYTECDCLGGCLTRC